MRVPGFRGNFSDMECLHPEFHGVVFQQHTYPIRLDGELLIVGSHTPLALLVTDSVCNFIAGCPYFERLVLKSYVSHDGKQYEATYEIAKCRYSDYLASLHVVIKTDKEFSYSFEDL